MKFDKNKTYKKVAGIFGFGSLWKVVDINKRGYEILECIGGDTSDYSRGDIFDIENDGYYRWFEEVEQAYEDKVDGMKVYLAMVFDGDGYETLKVFKDKSKAVEYCLNDFKKELEINDYDNYTLDEDNLVIEYSCRGRKLTNWTYKVKEYLVE